MTQAGAVELHNILVVVELPHDGYLLPHLVQQHLVHLAGQTLDGDLRRASPDGFVDLQLYSSGFRRD